MRGLIFKIFILSNVIQFFGCTTNFEFGQSSTRVNIVPKVQILDDWMNNEEFEFLLYFDPEVRFKVEIYNEKEPMNMIEGEYKKIDKKHFIIFKNIPWDLEKEKQKLQLKIGIGSEKFGFRFGFGQIIKRNFNEEISIISDGKEKLDKNMIRRQRFSEPKSKKEIKEKIERLSKAENICSYNNLECEWQLYYIKNNKIISLRNLISLNNKTIVNEGNSIHSAEQVELTKKLINLMESSRELYISLLKKQWELHSNEGWPIGPEPYIPDNLLPLLFPTMSDFQIPPQIATESNNSSPSNTLPLMNTPMDADIPNVSPILVAPAIVPSSSVGKRPATISLKKSFPPSGPAVQSEVGQQSKKRKLSGRNDGAPKVGDKKDEGEKRSKRIIIGGTEGEIPRMRGPRRPPKNPVEINRRKKTGVLRPKVVENIGENSRNPIVSGAQNIPHILGSSLIRNNVPMIEAERSNPPSSTRNEDNVNLNSVGQNFIHAEEEEEKESD